MITKNIFYDIRNGFSFKENGGDREVAENNFDTISTGICYNFMPEIDKYPEEKDTICLKEKEAAEIVKDGVIKYAEERIKHFQEVISKVQKEFDDLS